jgi:hypothetical protein
MIRQYPLTPAAGKRLIAKAAVRHPLIERVLRRGRLVIVAGTTNGYVAEEILTSIGQALGFSRQHFYRGITVAPDLIARAAGGIPGSDEFPGDVVIDKGVWKRTSTLYDVIEELGEDDVIVKGANTLDVVAGQAASFVDHRDGGPVGVILPAVLGRHVQLLIPVGLEKRVSGSLLHLAQRLATQGGKGPRLYHLPGEVLTELDAIAQLTDAHAEVVGAGGVAGAEGCVWLAVEGASEEMGQVDALMRSVLTEPGFALNALKT